MAYRADDPPAGIELRDHVIADYESLLHMLRVVYARLKSDVLPGVARLSVITNPLLIPYRDQVTEQVTRALRMLADIDLQTKLLLLSWPLPIRVWEVSAEWVQVRASVSGVAGDLGVTNREVYLRWHGVAADAYHAVVPAHVGAATRLATVAETVPFALNQAASAIAQMYAALLGTLVALVGSVLVGLGAAATGVGILAAVVLIVITVGGALTSLSGILTETAHAIGSIGTWMTRMVSDMQDNSAFPGGQWPVARSDLLTDATITDGDPSDWTVRS